MPDYAYSEGSIISIDSSIIDSMIKKLINVQ